MNVGSLRALFLETTICATVLRLLCFGLILGTLPRATADESQTSIGEIPLCDLGSGTFNGFAGGLYGGGSNVRPAEHEAAGVRISHDQIRPLDASGKPDADGKIVLISIGVSHTTMMFELEDSPPGGVFVLTARATDDLGATGESTVSIIISNSPALPKKQNGRSE